MIYYGPVTFPPLSGAHALQAQVLTRVGEAWGYVFEDFVRVRKPFEYLSERKPHDLDLMLATAYEAVRQGYSMERAWSEYEERLADELAEEEFELRMQAETEWSLRAGNV